MAEDATAVAEEVQETTEGVATDTGATLDAADWRSSLPEDLRDAPTIQQVKDVPAMAKKLVHAQRALGNNVGIPGKNSTDEERDTFYKAVGRPDEPSGYEMPVEGIPEGFEVPDEVMEGFRETAHRTGITDQQAAALYRWYAESDAGAKQMVATQSIQQREVAVAALRQEWGVAYEQNITQAQRAIQQFGSDEVFSAINNAGLGDNPDVLKFLASVGKAVADDEIMGTGGATQHALAPSEAQNEIAALKKDQGFVTRLAAGDVDTKKKWDALHREAFPEEVVPAGG